MFLPDVTWVEKSFPQLTDVNLLARGGQKLVFRATHARYGTVVIKFILDASSNERTKREVDVATKYQISNIPKVYEYSNIENHGDQAVYLIEEFIDGITLREFLKANGKVSLKTALDILEALLVTAVELEKNRIVHRDIKPENIIIKKAGGICLLDFGIARLLSMPSLTLTKAHFGPCTPGYAAPEQFRNLKKEIDIRADLFSIGVTIYESISGKNPFITDGSHPLDALRRTETIQPMQFEIPGDTQKQLIGFLSIMMDKFPSRRPNSAETALKWFHALRPTLNLEGEE
ncbi:MAG TPA: serine/threonine-protein kinase [Bacillota bacterium]